MSDGHNLKWTQSQVDTILNAHNPIWTQSRMDTILNAHIPKWTQSRMGTYKYTIISVIYKYCFVKSLLQRRGFD